MKERLSLQNLKCNGCATTILKTLNAIVGIKNIVVDVDSGIVAYEYAEMSQSYLAKKQLKSMGYPLVSEKNGMSTIAKSFVSCGMGRMSRKAIVK